MSNRHERRKAAAIYRKSKRKSLDESTGTMNLLAHPSQLRAGLKEHKQMTPNMPMWVFYRRHDIELEAGYQVAGLLFIDLGQFYPDLPKSRKKRDKLVNGLLTRLFEHIHRSCAQQPKDDYHSGWQVGRKREDDVDLFDDTLMEPWRERCDVINVRMGETDDMAKGFRIDSDMMQQMGFMPPTPSRDQ